MMTLVSQSVLVTIMEKLKQLDKDNRKVSQTRYSKINPKTVLLSEEMLSLLLSGSRAGISPGLFVQMFLLLP